MNGKDAMAPTLTVEEESYLKDLLNNQSRGIRPLDISANLLLLAGGLLLVGTANDRHRGVFSRIAEFCRGDASDCRLHIPFKESCSHEETHFDTV
jgi:hypothetical protein